MSVVFSIDPGPLQSGWVAFDGGKVLASGVDRNEDLRGLLIDGPYRDAGVLAIEMIASYGMAVGASVFETCRWVGRFEELWACNGRRVRLVYRKDVKMHLCGSPRAKDANIRQALIDKVGPPGLKASPGPTYGVKSHAWAALAVAVTAMEMPG